MRKLSLIIGLLFCAGTALAQTPGTCVGNGAYLGTSASISIAPPNGQTINIVVSVATNPTATFTSLKDNNGNNFIADNPAWVEAGLQNWMRYFHLTNTISVTSVVLTFNTNQIFAFIGCPVAGLSVTPVDFVDPTGTSTASGSTWTSTPAVTNYPNEIIYGAGGDPSGGKTRGCTSPWLLATNVDVGGSYDLGMCYQVVSSKGTYTPTGTVSPNSYTYALTASYTAPAASGHCAACDLARLNSPKESLLAKDE